ncbi:uncharacterized protein N0V96_003412 [Colletotrichum fioriniae]|uniref:uncharacterized protein n=1 Tax=Colletotrichum fioriniae TaxID=710243 RepID=UPI0032D9D2D9|nr:hypothetical protein N0V96_003412 [Colletotrichum fioriniae]
MPPERRSTGTPSGANKKAKTTAPEAEVSSPAPASAPADDDRDSREQHLAFVELERQKPKQKCDGGKTCLCTKPAAKHPDVPYVITHAGFRKLMNQ